MRGHGQMCLCPVAALLPLEVGGQWGPALQVDTAVCLMSRTTEEVAFTTETPALV